MGVCAHAHVCRSHEKPVHPAHLFSFTTQILEKRSIEPPTRRTADQIGQPIADTPNSRTPPSAGVFETADVPAICNLWYIAR